jgi:SAM-dependent methyltransferase
MDVADDPNAPPALMRRAEALRRAWQPSIPDRGEFLVERVRGKKVLDIGCVAHDVSRMAAAEWLHRRLAESASSCVGIDVLEAGVEHMLSLGFAARVCDIRQGVGPVADLAPFDVIVAGELIEHVESLDMLFLVARELLEPTGELIITTPNPYSPSRVRAGQRGIVWENVDHILYAFPSGIAELCERNGLELAEAGNVIEPTRRHWRIWVRRVKRRVRGTRWVAVGYATRGARRQVAVDGPLAFVHDRYLRARGRFVGETFVYVITRPHDQA